MGSLCLFGPSVRHSEASSGRSAVILACGLLVYTCKVPWLPAVTATPSHAQTLDLQLRDREPLSLSSCNNMESLRYPLMLECVSIYGKECEAFRKEHVLAPGRSSPDIQLPPQCSIVPASWITFGLMSLDAYWHHPHLIFSGVFRATHVRYT